MFPPVVEVRAVTIDRPLSVTMNKTGHSMNLTDQTVKLERPLASVVKIDPSLHRVIALRVHSQQLAGGLVSATSKKHVLEGHREWNSGAHARTH